MFAAMDHFLGGETLDLLRQLGRRAVAMVAHRLDEERLALGKGRRQRVVEGGRVGVAAVPPAPRLRLARKAPVARGDRQVGWCHTCGVHDYTPSIMCTPHRQLLTRMSISLKLRRRMSPGESRAAALEAARDLLLEAGPQAVTLKAVAARIGRTHANLLHHFGSAAELQSALAGHISGQVTRQIGDAVERARSGE